MSIREQLIWDGIQTARQTCRDYYMHDRDKRRETYMRIRKYLVLIRDVRKQDAEYHPVSSEPQSTERAA